MNKYDEMSDFEINGSIAVRLGSNKCSKHCNASILISLKNAVVTDFGVKDYCNNPADMWPIVFDNDISLISAGGDKGYYANNGYLHHSGSIFDDTAEYYSENPLRAAAIVFLMMKDMTE